MNCPILVHEIVSATCEKCLLKVSTKFLCRVNCQSFLSLKFCICGTVKTQQIIWYQPKTFSGYQTMYSPNVFLLNSIQRKDILATLGNHPTVTAVYIMYADCMLTLYKNLTTLDILGHPHMLLQWNWVTMITAACLSGRSCIFKGLPT